MFEGREHSGIDVSMCRWMGHIFKRIQDARNIARIVIELAARGVDLKENLDISSTRRYSWMGPNGTITNIHS